LFSGQNLKEIEVTIEYGKELDLHQYSSERYRPLFSGIPAAAVERGYRELRIVSC
jgi:hypothetical protein